MQVTPYLAVLDPIAALEFYAAALGGEVTLVMRNKDFPDGGMPDTPPETVMHAAMKYPDGAILASESHEEPPEGSPPVTLSIHFDDVPQGRAIFDKLSDGGTITMPFEKTFWAEGFGMLRDKFGITWMIDCGPAEGT